MHNSLKVLLEKIGSDVSKKHKEKQHKTGIILGFSKSDSDEQFLLNQIRRIKSFVKEILISIPNNWVNENHILEKECETFPIKFIERSSNDKPISLPIFDFLVKHSLNDNIMFLSNNHNLSQDKVEKLLIQDLPICTFIGQKGNILSSIGFYDKWVNRFMIQVLILNNRHKLIDIFRISNSKLFLKIAKADSILMWGESNNNSRKLEAPEGKSVFVPLRFHSEIDIQDLVKTVAIMQVLQKEMEEKDVITSKFKVQHLLHLSRKFSTQGHHFLAFQIPYFFMEKPENNINLPANWTKEKILDFGRKLLLEESNSYAHDKISRLRKCAFEDLINNNLIKDTEKEWISKEIAELAKDISSDNIVFMDDSV